MNIYNKTRIPKVIWGYGLLALTYYLSEAYTFLPILSDLVISGIFGFLALDAFVVMLIFGRNILTDNIKFARSRFMFDFKYNPNSIYLNVTRRLLLEFILWLPLAYGTVFLNLHFAVFAILVYLVMISIVTPFVNAFVVNNRDFLEI